MARLAWGPAPPLLAKTTGATGCGETAGNLCRPVLYTDQVGVDAGCRTPWSGYWAGPFSVFSISSSFSLFFLSFVFPFFRFLFYFIFLSVYFFFCSN
jgi:hypothetical protein